MDISTELSEAFEKTLKRPIADRMADFESRKIGWTIPCVKLVYTGFDKAYRRLWLGSKRPPQ